MEVPSKGSCWGGVLGQIFFDEPSPISLLLLRLTVVSICDSSVSTAGGYFLFFLEVLAGGIGEEAGGLVGLLDSTGTDTGSAGAGSGSNDFSWLGGLFF